MRETTWLFSVILLASMLTSGVTRAEPPEPMKYATIEEGKDEGVHKVLFSPTGDSLSYMYSGKTIANWDVKTKKSGNLLHNPDTYFLDMAYSPDGKVLAVSQFTKVNLINARTGESNFLYNNKKSAYRVRYSADGKRIVTDDRGVIKVWDVEKNAEAIKIKCVTKGSVEDMALIPGTDLLLAGISVATPDTVDPKITVSSSKFVLADVKTGKVKTLLENSSPRADGALAATQDGKHFAFADFDEVILGSTAAWKTEAIPEECPLYAMVCLFSDSGRFLIAGGIIKKVPTYAGKAGGGVAIYDRERKKWISRFTVLDCEVTSMTLSPKNDLLAVSSNKFGTITVWDISAIIKDPPKEEKKVMPDKK